MLISDFLAAVARMGHGPANFIITHGRPYGTDDKTFSGRRGKKHCCYMNAGRIAMADATLTYVEGYATVCGVPIEHAWTVTETGVVRDPTVKAGSVEEYFGVPFKTDYLRRTIVKTGVWGLFCRKNHELLDAAPEEFLDKPISV